MRYNVEAFNVSLLPDIDDVAGGIEILVDNDKCKITFGNLRINEHRIDGDVLLLQKLNFNADNNPIWMLVAVLDDDCGRWWSIVGGVLGHPYAVRRRRRDREHASG